MLIDSKKLRAMYWTQYLEWRQTASERRAVGDIDGAIVAYKIAATWRRAVTMVNALEEEPPVETTT